MENEMRTQIHEDKRDAINERIDNFENRFNLNKYTITANTLVSLKNDVATVPKPIKQIFTIY